MTFFHRIACLIGLALLPNLVFADETYKHEGRFYLGFYGHSISEVFRDVHAEGVGQGVGWVPDERELGLAHSRRGLVPDLVGEVRVGGDDVPTI